jgi:ABC-2 type transport system permease protein
MQPSYSTYSAIKRIATKETTLFFSSPIAYLFLATFAAITLFAFFWGEAFFARNIADVRPLFEWIPVLLIFLSGTLTMKLWSEERRAGTLEHILTQPAPLWSFVLGKFLGCLLLLGIALLITLPLPVTVSILGDLDWGPVFAGYMATFLLGAAYLSIGLFVSARSENQIVSLISAVTLCGLLYIIGTPSVTTFFGTQMGEWLRLLGTGSRFDAIERGVVDFRDLYYYLSIVAVFLVLNVYVLEKERWANHSSASHHKRWTALTGLLIANALGANLWLGQLTVLRADVTAGNQYSISDATTNYLNQLQEPLLIRGYFSSKTHPLLAPLVPQLRDLIQEYEIAGKGKVRVEIVDPVSDPDVEKEANQKFGIQPVPFQVADRYEASIVSSYFNVVVQYADEHQMLGFRDLIEVKSNTEGDIDVQLRNPEHDMTRAVKKVLNAYQAGGNLFDTVKGDLAFTAYVSDDSKLPEQLTSFKETVNQVLSRFQSDADGRLTVSFIDPDADQTVAQQIATDYGFQPLTTSLFSDQSFYFYLTLAKGEQIVQIPLGDMTQSTFERDLEAGIKRFASGFTKTVALVTPTADYAYGQYGNSSKQFRQLEEFLGAELNVRREDISDGSVSGDADVLVLAAPQGLTETEVFAVDQFLMQGGTIIAATSPFSANLSSSSLSLQPHGSGLEKWLEYHGLTIGEQVVLDKQNAAFPVPVTRNVGGFQLQEMRMLDYPYFVDIRKDGLNQDNVISADLPQLTMAWASPITVDQEAQQGREVIRLAQSSERSWLSESLNVMPSVSNNGVSTFEPDSQQSSHLLGVMTQGRFDSYFAGQSSPLVVSEQDNEASAEEVAGDEQSQRDAVISSVIERSPESARIILFSSNDFLDDQINRMAGAATGSEYLNAVQLIANSLDYAFEDTGLLSIRSRGHFNRTLPSMERDSQLFWEYLNYILAALSIVMVALVQTYKRKRKQRAYFQLLAN